MVYRERLYDGMVSCIRNQSIMILMSLLYCSLSTVSMVVLVPWSVHLPYVQLLHYGKP